MPVIESRIDTNSAQFRQNREDLLAKIAEFRAIEAKGRAEEESKREKFHKRGQLMPRERVHMMLDRGSPWLELQTLAGYKHHDDKDGSLAGGNTIIGIGYVEGTRCIVSASNFAIKGGTGINLFVQNMPRLSVDIDVVYLPWQLPRDEALRAINQELAAVGERVQPLGLQTRLIRAKDLGETKLIVENETSQVKVEVNVVFRGTVLPVEHRPLCAKASDLFGVEFDTRV